MGSSSLDEIVSISVLNIETLHSTIYIYRIAIVIFNIETLHSTIYVYIYIYIYRIIIVILDIETLQSTIYTYMGPFGDALGEDRRSRA